VIALVTTYIAVQQYRTNRLRFRLEMFEKRYAVYQGVVNDMIGTLNANC